MRFFFARDGETYDQEVGTGHTARRRSRGDGRPYATPPDLLERRLCSKTAEALDFALVRLARQVTNIAYLDIEKPPSPRTEAVWVIGFPRGGPVVLPNATIRKRSIPSRRAFSPRRIPIKACPAAAASDPMRSPWASTRAR